MPGEPANPAIKPLPPGLSEAAAIIIVGGTFDPPHRAHVELPVAARTRLDTPPGTWLLYIPAARSPHKSSGPAASEADRIQMLRLATADVPRCAIWTDEIDRARAGAPSYTIDTLSRLRSALPPSTRLILCIGTDQATSLHRWHQPRCILELAELLVLPRQPLADRGRLAEALRTANFWTDSELVAISAALIPDLELPAAATDIRAAIACGQMQHAQSALHPAVYAHIREHGLYQR